MKFQPLTAGKSSNTSELRPLGELVRNRRISLEIRLDDAAAGAGISKSILFRLENGKTIGTDSLFRILRDFGLVVAVRATDGAPVAPDVSSQQAFWYELAAEPLPTVESAQPIEPVMDQTIPTLFLDFDGTLHVGRGIIDLDADVSLDTGRKLFEFGPLLVEVLRPYPLVEIVLTTSWLQHLTEDEVISRLPTELARRVVGTTKGCKPRFGHMKSGAGKTDVIVSYAYGKRLKNWLALDDEVFGAAQFGYEFGSLIEHFLLLNPNEGIGGSSVKDCIQKWLERVHQVKSSVDESKYDEDN